MSTTRTGIGRRRTTDTIYLHCTDTPPAMDVDIATVRRWHTDAPPKGNGWKEVGYHYLIKRDGTLEKGRDTALLGAGVAGHNATSVHVALVGGRSARGRRAENNFTDAQWRTLKMTLDSLRRRYAKSIIKGHNEDDSGKYCPSFNVAEWLAAEGIPRDTR